MCKITFFFVKKKFFLNKNREMYFWYTIFALKNKKRVCVQIVQIGALKENEYNKKIFYLCSVFITTSIMKQLKIK